MPKKIVVAAKKPTSHAWTCPDCGQVIKHTFDGEEHTIDRGHGHVSMCGGLFESVIVECRACKCTIEITRKEMEEVV